MALGTKISSATAIDMCAIVNTRLVAGATVPYLEIRKDAKPAGPDTAHSGNAADILARIDLQDPAFGTPTDQGAYAQAALQGVPLQDASANNTGTAVWFRAYDSNGVAVIDGTCGTGTAGVDFDMVLDNTSIVATQPVTITSWLLRHNE